MSSPTPSADGVVGTVAEALAALGGALVGVAVLMILLLATYRRVLRPRLVAELVRLSGASIVHALPPRDVMITLLSKVYGESDANHGVVVGLLGGEGVEPEGADLTVSVHTTVTMRLRGIDHNTFEWSPAVTYSFKDRVPDYRFVIFATCDPLLRDSIALACRQPLYEAWFVPDQSLFDTSVSEMRSSVQVGIRYTDHQGRQHEVEPAKVELTEVGYQDWPSFLRFFREPVGTMSRQNPMHYMRTLRIFECDLGELADDDHTVDSVESLSLQAKILQRIDEGFCYWQPPYPCYVESILFEAADLSVDENSSWLFRVVPFAFQSRIVTGDWTRAEALKDLCVRSWLLPGHGVALLWKPSSDDQESFGDTLES